GELQSDAEFQVGAAFGFMGGEGAPGVVKAQVPSAPAARKFKAVDLGSSQRAADARGSTRMRLKAARMPGRPINGAGAMGGFGMGGMSAEMPGRASGFSGGGFGGAGPGGLSPSPGQPSGGSAEFGGMAFGGRFARSVSEWLHEGSSRNPIPGPE